MKKTLLILGSLASLVYASNDFKPKPSDLKYLYSSSRVECLKVDHNLQSVLLDKNINFTVTDVKIVSDHPKLGKLIQFIVKTADETLPFTIFSKKGACLLYKDINLGVPVDNALENPKYLAN